MTHRRSRTLAPDTVKLRIEEVQDTVVRAQPKQASLVVLQGSESEIGTHTLIDRPITIGRDLKAELPLQDEGISRLHCRIYHENDAYLIEDLKSTNGTLVNGQRIELPTELKPGDRIDVGACVVKFSYADALEVDYHAQMNTLVGTDDLTGLVARRRFDSACLRAVAEARQARAPLAVLMIDLDGLKQINDRHGHPVGAHTIAEVGRLIGKVVAERGAVSRLGGDEFAAFLPGVPKQEARTLGEELRRAMASHRFEKDGVVVRPTLSVGVSAFPEDGASAETLLRKADEALYRAKRRGRDRVET